MGTVYRKGKYNKLFMPGVSVIWAFTQAIQNLVTNGDATFDKKTGYRLSK